MSTSKEFLRFILDQLSGLEDITHRQMMGEFIIYYRGKIAAYLCDDRFLVKLMPNARMEAPYEGAKEMLLVENVDDRAFLQRLLENLYPELPEPKKKKRRT